MLQRKLAMECAEGREETVLEIVQKGMITKCAVKPLPSEWGHKAHLTVEEVQTAL